MVPVLRTLFWWVAALVAALFSLAAAADPPARVGRLSLVEGAVTFRIDRQDTGSAAAYNWPISTGALLDTGRNGRAEVQIGSSVFRLAGDSSVEFVAVDDSRIDLQVARGSLGVTVRERDQADDIDIATPGGEVSFDAPGRYRIDVDPRAGNVDVSAREGMALVDRPGGQLEVPAGRRGVVYADGGWILDDLQPDAFDAWADSRDAVAGAPQARRYVSPEMTGYEDLDRYGDWGTVPDYGAVWYPQAIPLGWAPYRYGRWAWVPPWGWTWVDEAPWGFAPFHYGRWLFLGGRWAWVPGAYVERPVYAPALVAWIGNPGWSVSFAFGSSPAVGWFPLAPREVFIPAYRSSHDYVRRANRGHVANVTVIDRAVKDFHSHSRTHPAFANRQLPQAVTVVPANVMRSGTTINPAQVRHPPRQDVGRAPVAVQAPNSAWIAPAEGARRPRREGPPVAVTPAAPADLSPRPQAPAPMPAQPQAQPRPRTIPGAVTAVPPRGDRDMDRRHPSGVEGRPGIATPSPTPIRPQVITPGAPQGIHPAYRPDFGRPPGAERPHERPAERPPAIRSQLVPQARPLAPPPPAPVVRESAPHRAAPEGHRFESRPAAPREGRHDHGTAPNAR
ncbi:MAG TPA: DUF6600 domain-containing protein [Rhodocyclaceae bacterium]|nr:DUF6600 domain-containing protein [Rhodocyclaceae bacterium]